MVGFVGYALSSTRGKLSHTNRSEFYITINPMKGFDKNFVVFGRVVEGLNYLRKVSSQQDINNLIPAIQLKITDMAPVVKGPTSRSI